MSFGSGFTFFENKGSGIGSDFKYFKGFNSKTGSFRFGFSSWTLIILCVSVIIILTYFVLVF